MKTAIVYASVHHKNTEKVVKAIAEKHPEVELIDATKTILKDLASYDLVGFASGIFYGKLHKSLISFIIYSLNFLFLCILLFRLFFYFSQSFLKVLQFCFI